MTTTAVPRASQAHRLPVGVVVPATDGTTGAEIDDLRPRGVVTATTRIANPDRIGAGGRGVVHPT